MVRVVILYFSFAIVRFDMIMHSNSTPKKFSRSRSFCYIGQRSLVNCQSTFSKDFFPETTGKISFKCHMQSPGKKGKDFLYLV